MAWRRWVAATVGLGLWALAPPAGAEPVDGVVVPAGPVVISTGDPATGTLEVENQTSEPVTIVAAPQGTGGDANRCDVTITKNRTVPAASTQTLSFSVAATEACPDPDDGDQQVVLLAGASADPQVIVRRIAEAEGGEPAEVKATGVKLPDDTVFLRRKGSLLTGSIEVANTTTTDVVVVPSTVGPDCGVTPATPPTAEDPPDPDDVIASGDTRSIAITVPGACEDLDADELGLTVLTATVDGTKYDWSALTLEAEVDWRRLWGPVLAILLVAFLLAFAAGEVGLWAVNRKAISMGSGAAGSSPAAPTARVGWTDPLVTDADAPKSWLTGLATVGPLATTLFTTTGVVDGISGASGSAPVTMVVIGTAVALLLVGLSTLVTTTRTVAVKDDEGKSKEVPVVWQFVLGAALTASSAAIALLLVGVAAVDLDLPGGDWWSTGLLALFALILVGYLMWSVDRYITRFVKPRNPTPPPPTPPAPKPIPPEVAAAALSSTAPAFAAGAPPDDAMREAWVTDAYKTAALMAARLDAKVAADAATQVEAIGQQISAAAPRDPKVKAMLGEVKASADASTAAAEAGHPAEAAEEADKAVRTTNELLAEVVRAIDEDAATLPDDVDLAELEARLDRLAHLTTSPGDEPMSAPLRMFAAPERSRFTDYLI